MIIKSTMFTANLQYSKRNVKSDIIRCCVWLTSSCRFAEIIGWATKLLGGVVFSGREGLVVLPALTLWFCFFSADSLIPEYRKVNDLFLAVFFSKGAL